MSRTTLWRVLAVGAMVVAGPSPSSAQLAPGPASRAQAAAVLSGGVPAPYPCLTPRLETPLVAPAPAALRRAVLALREDPILEGERRWRSARGTLYRYALGRSFDAIPPADRDANGAPDLLESLEATLAGAGQWLASKLGIPSPQPREVVLADLGPEIQGYTIAAPEPAAGFRIVLNAQLPAGELRHGAVHQLAHIAVSGVRADWAEALATWSEISWYGLEAGSAATAVRARLARLREGLMADDLRLAAGNALWLVFFEETYGAENLPWLAKALRGSEPVREILERAVQQASGQTLAEAFRDFHLWCVLTGPYDDGRHFPFASLLPEPNFASTVRGLPELSVQSEPAVGSWGATQIRLDPQLQDLNETGLTVLFEGDMQASWAADLLLVYEDRTLQRVALELGEDARGQATVPAGRLQEVLLLVRNLAPPEFGPRRYSWSAFVEPGFPFRLASFEARPLGAGEGVLLEWETLQERDLLGFNIVRYRDEGGGMPVRVNPVWIPAVGDESPMAYTYLDADAEPGVRYTYRLEGITQRGLTSSSDPVRVFVPER